MPRFTDDDNATDVRDVELREQAGQVVAALIAALTARIAEASEPATLSTLRDERSEWAQELRQLSNASPERLREILDELPACVEAMRAGREHG